jgi:hypothetical protein
MDTAGSTPPLRGHPDASDTQQNQEGERPLQSPDLVSDWEKLIYTLTTISLDLSKEEDIASQKGIAQNLQDAIGQVHAINAKVTCPTPEQRRRRDLRLLPMPPPEDKNGPPSPRRKHPTATLTQAAARIRLEDNQGTARETLAKASTIIPESYAIYTLQRGDIDVLVPSQTIKDQILNQPEIQGCKVLRLDYLIEIPGVPFSTSIVNEKSSNKEDTIKSICKGMKRLLPTFVITKIRWLHDLTAQATRNPTVVKTRGIVILGLRTQDMQYQAIKKGVIINSKLHDARLLKSKCLPKQCFQCCQWGNSQAACKKQANEAG